MNLTFPQHKKKKEMESLNNIANGLGTNEM